MSIQALAWAWRQPLKPTRKLVLLALADHAGDDGECFPAVGRISEFAGVSRSVTFTHLAALEAAGLIRRDERKRSNGSRSANLYVLNLDGGTVPLAGPTPSGEQDGPPSGEQDPLNHQKEPPIEPNTETDDPVWLYWLEKRQPARRVMPEGTRRQLAKARRKGYTDEQLKQAIDGLLNDEFYQRIKKVRLSSIFATRPDGPTLEEQVDEFIEKGTSVRRELTPLMRDRIDVLKDLVRRGYRRPDDASAQRDKAAAESQLRDFGVQIGWNIATNQPTFKDPA